jgi:hypothetical protein
MSDYTPSTDFAAKDSLLSGNPAKVVKGTEFATEFSAIATAVSTKYDSSSVVPVAAGGTGATTLTGLIKGVGTAAMVAAVAGTDYLAPAAIGVTVQGYDVDTAKLDVAQSFTAAQRGAVVALTDAANIATNMALANNFAVTLGGNRTLDNPTNQTAGQGGVIVITQDGTGSRTLAYGSNWKFPNGTAPTLTTTASAVDVLVYQVESASRITARVVNDVK